MKELNLKVYPEKILRKKVKNVVKITDEEREILKEMLSLMKANKGIGLAANQVGVDRQLFVIDLQDGYGPLFIINPKIVKREGVTEMEEGCLSIPGCVVKVKRAEKVTVEGLDIEGKSIKIEARGLLARALQHEIDHLNGRLIIDYLNIRDRLKLVLRLRKTEKKG
jgi:peptide deformylase